MCFIMDPDACDSPSMITIYLLLKSTPPHSEKAILQYGNRYDDEPLDFKRIGSDACLNIATGENLDIYNTNIRTAPGVVLDDRQKTIVGSVLDVSNFYNLMAHDL